MDANVSVLPVRTFDLVRRLLFILLAAALKMLNVYTSFKFTSKGSTLDMINNNSNQMSVIAYGKAISLPFPFLFLMSFTVPISELKSAIFLFLEESVCVSNITFTLGVSLCFLFIC